MVLDGLHTGKEAGVILSEEQVHLPLWPLDVSPAHLGELGVGVGQIPTRGVSPLGK